MSKKCITYLDKNGNQIVLAEGDIVVTCTRLPTDIYKSNDPQVLNSIRKNKERKKRYTIIVEIVGKNTFIGVSVSHTKHANNTQKIYALNLCNTSYIFVTTTTQKYNVLDLKRFKGKAKNNHQIQDPIGTLNSIISLPNYQKKLQK